MHSNTTRVWIFDMDGTLVDSMGHFADLAGEVIHRHYGAPQATAREQYRQTSGLPFAEQLESLYPGNGTNPTAVTAFETAKAARYLTMTPFPEVPQVLGRLRERGCVVAVSSNNFQSLVETYATTHALPIDIVCGWRPGFAKGASHFLHVARVSGHDLASAAFVGDSLNDVSKAKAAGLDFIARTGTFAAAEFHTYDPTLPVIHSLEELLE